MSSNFARNQRRASRTITICRADGRTIATMDEPPEEVKQAVLVLQRASEAGEPPGRKYAWEVRLVMGWLEKQEDRYPTPAFPGDLA